MLGEGLPAECTHGNETQNVLIIDRKQAPDGWSDTAILRENGPHGIRTSDWLPVA